MRQRPVRWLFLAVAVTAIATAGTATAIALTGPGSIMASPTVTPATNASTSANASAGTTGETVFFDDFDGTSIDTTKWFPGLHQISHEATENGVVPENLSVHAMDDNGTSIGVLDAVATGDQYDDSQSGAIKGVHKIKGCAPLGSPDCYTRLDTGKRTGGLLWTNKRFGAGRYEVRMKNLPGPGGCSCIWNYYESDSGEDYTEIDIEMPAHNENAFKTDWHNWAGLNTYTLADDDHATYINTDLGSAQNDGGFHVYRWDWYDGTNGTKRLEWYVDGVLKATANEDVPSSAAQLWVGTWAAPWSGKFDFTTQHMYVDWVKISTLGDGDGTLITPTGDTGTEPNGGTDPTPTSTTPTSTSGASPTASPSGSTGTANKVINGDFDGASLSPWTCAGDAEIVAARGVGGGNAARLGPTNTTTARCTQTITGLTAGRSYTLKAQLRGTSGQWIYVGRVVNGVAVERGTRRTSYALVTVPSFTAPASGTVQVYVSAWGEQVGDTFADNVTMS